MSIGSTNSSTSSRIPGFSNLACFFLDFYKTRTEFIFGKLIEFTGSTEGPSDFKTLILNH